MPYNGNAGYLFQHLYYRDIDFLKYDNPANKTKFKNANDLLYSAVVIPVNFPEEFASSNTKLITTYPGLLAGIGYVHETGIEGELKLGFSFDYTSGMPVIPGSSVKGIIRSTLENASLSEIIIELLEPSLGKKLREGKEAFIYEIFENDNKSTYNSDVFFDAIVTDIVENNFSSDSQTFNQKKLFGPDNIAYHPSPLENPLPIAFLKIMPCVQFGFRFRLQDSAGFTAEEKEIVFKTALLLNGVGAKTNVGYGQFTEVLPKEKSEFKQVMQKSGQSERVNERPARQQAYEGLSKVERLLEQTKLKQKDGPKNLELTEQPDWINPEDVKVNTILKSTVISSKNGSLELRLHLKKYKVTQKLDGKEPQGTILNVMVKTIEGSVKKDNFTPKVIRAKV